MGILGVKGGQGTRSFGVSRARQERTNARKSRQTKQEDWKCERAGVQARMAIVSWKTYEDTLLLFSCPTNVQDLSNDEILGFGGRTK